MSTTFRRIARASIIGLMVGVAPVASAMSQEIAQPNSGQALVQQTAAGQPVGQPASMAAPSIQSPLAEAQQAADEVAVAERELAAFEAEADALRPGQFVWKADRQATGRVEMVVSIPQQKMYVYRDNKLIAVSTISSGRSGHRTPTGVFPIIEKRRTHFSNLYNNAPMPNMQRLTMGGIALHAGQLPGYPASHGCIRLPMEFSRLLFGITSRGERVHIIAGSPTPRGALAMATGRTGVQMAAR